MTYSEGDIQRFTDDEELLDTLFYEGEETGDQKCREGLASRGASKPWTFANGVTRDLKSEGIVPNDTDPSDLFSAVLVRDFEGKERQDVILPFAEDNPIDFSKLVMWRVQNGFFKWISDYRDQEDLWKL